MFIYANYKPNFFKGKKFIQCAFGRQIAMRVVMYKGH